MNKGETIRIAVAESSLIIRTGLVSVLKRLPLNIKTIEATSPDGLENSLHTDTPDILIVNPTFGGWFNIEQFKADSVHANVKIIALNCIITNNQIHQNFDETISLHEDIDDIRKKIELVLEIKRKEVDNENETLSSREKEIVVCVVKGLTNKEIAEQLFLSIHTVITHRRNIARKLEIHSTAGLTIYAIVNKLVEINEIKL